MSDIDKVRASREAREAVGHRRGSSRSFEQMAEIEIRRYLASIERQAKQAREDDEPADEPTPST